MKNLQHWGLALDTIAAGLYSPSSNVGGSLAAAASPAMAQQIGSYFKGLAAQNQDGKLNNSQQAAHVLAHGILAASVAAAGGNDALTAGITAGGAEAAAPYVSKWLYGTDDPEKLSAEQKSTVSAITGLGGAVTSTTTGNVTDVVGGSQAAQNAVENNELNMIGAMFPKINEWGSQAQGIYTYELQKGATHEQASQAVQIYLRGKDPHSNAVVKGMGTGLVVIVGGTTVVITAPTVATNYLKEAGKSAVTGVAVNAALGKDYTTADLIYDASLGILIDKKTGAMVKWAGDTSPWVGRYIRGHGVIENHLLGIGTTEAIGNKLGESNQIIFKSSDWLHK